MTPRIAANSGECTNAGDCRNATVVIMYRVEGAVLRSSSWGNSLIASRSLGVIPVEEKNGVLRIRLGWKTPIDSFLVAFLGLSCVAAVGLHLTLHRGAVKPEAAVQVVVGVIALALLPALWIAVRNFLGREDLVINVGESQLKCLQCPMGHRKAASRFQGTLAELESINREGDTWMFKGRPKSHFFLRFTWLDDKKVDLVGIADRELVDKLVGVVRETCMPSIKRSIAQSIKDLHKVEVVPPPPVSTPSMELELPWIPTRVKEEDEEDKPSPAPVLQFLTPDQFRENQERALRAQLEAEEEARLREAEPPTESAEWRKDFPLPPPT